MPAASTRDRILDHGLSLISRCGLEGVTLGVLAGQVGMSKSGLFAHFRSKEEVQIALLDHTAQFATTHVVAPAMAAAEGVPRLRALIANWFGWSQKAGLPGGCPVAAGLFEYDDIDGRVRSKILELEAEWRTLLTKLTLEAISRGHLDRNLDVTQFVWELCAIYLGHHAAYRFVRSADADSRAGKAIESLLHRSAHARRGARKVRHA